MKQGHGNAIHDFDRELIDFSSNVNPFGVDRLLIDHLNTCVGSIANYPDPRATRLSKLLASYHQIDPSRILVTNGSVEAFYLIAQLYAAKKSAIIFPSFAEYADSCSMHNHSLCFFADLSAFVETNGRSSTENFCNLLWMGNPNNPDGRCTSSDSLEEAFRQFPKTLFIIDEAYIDLIPGLTSAITLIDKYSNLLVVRSMTKRWAIPGLRLGYVVGQADVIQAIGHLQIPWSVNQLAQEAGCFILSHPSSCQPIADHLCLASQNLQSRIDEIKGFKVLRSPAPFFLVEMEWGSCDTLCRYLLDNHGILIRNASNFKGLSTRHFRVATGTEMENNLLIKALSDFSL